VENQLSPSLISLSPLFAHRHSILQHTRVRSSSVLNPSICTRIDHLVSGLILLTKFITLYYNIFNYAPIHNSLSLLAKLGC